MTPPQDPPLTLDEHLCFALYGASMEIGRLYKPLLDERGLTYPQYLVLSALWERDRQPVGTVAQRLGLEPSTLTPMVRRLEGEGLLVRDRNPADERQVVLCLTDEGRAMQGRSACLAEALVARSGMTMERLLALNEDVRALRDAIAAHGRQRAEPKADAA